MVKTDLKDAYLGRTTPTALHNEVSTLQKNYYDTENCVMVNQSVNESHTRFLFKSDELHQYSVSPMEISVTYFNKLSPKVREFLIS